MRKKVSTVLFTMCVLSSSILAGDVPAHGVSDGSGSTICWVIEVVSQLLS
ncbi:MAG: hypothetical protein HKN25_08835 [Pyrinomonadaceae bacterium]|nr:hypothetical protein [Pyrinomonadaceae bacterium]